MLLCRCDVDHSDFITDVVDPRDHEYVQGATVSIRSLIETLKEAAEGGGANLLKVRRQWIKDAGVMTFDEAVKNAATEEEYKMYASKLGSNTVSLKERRELAKQSIGKEIFFDWDLARSREGSFMFKSCIKAVVERAIAVAPLGDVTWARMDLPRWDDLVSFHDQLRKVYPDRIFAFGYTGDCNFGKAGFSPEAVKSLPSDLAKMGVAWQVQPIWGLQGLNYQTKKFAQMWSERGIEGYIEEVQKPALSSTPMTDGFEKPSYSGAYLADCYFDTIAARDKKESVWTSVV